MYPVPALASESEDISAFPDLKKDPFSCFFRLKKHPYFHEKADFWGKKMTIFSKR